MNSHQVAVLFAHFAPPLLVAFVLYDGVYLRRAAGSVRITGADASRVLRGIPRRLASQFVWCAVVYTILDFAGSNWGSRPPAVALVLLTATRWASIQAVLLLVMELVPACIAGWVYQPTLSSFPGWRLQRLAQWIFSRRTCEQVLEPVLSDIHEEFIRANAEGRPVKARWVQLRGYACFWSHVALQIPFDLARIVGALWRLRA